jgi:hypothetical protein
MVTREDNRSHTREQAAVTVMAVVEVTAAVAMSGQLRRVVKGRNNRDQR